MTTTAKIGYGTTVEVEQTAGAGDYLELGMVTSVTPPNEKVDQIDVTDMQSPNRTREFISGLRDPGEMSFDINYVPGNTTEDLLLAWRAAGENRAVRLTYADTGEADTFDAFVLSFTPSMGVADVMKATVTLKVAGAVVRS